jgi:hypothetical protein
MTFEEYLHLSCRDLQFLQDAAAVLDRAARVRADAHIKALPPPPRAVGNERDRQPQPQEQEQPQARVQVGMPRHLRDLVQAAGDRGVALLLLPQGMSLRRANKSHFNRKASHIVWSVRVSFGREDPVVSMFPDSVTISHILASLLRPSQVGHAAPPPSLHPPADGSALPRQPQPQRVKRLPGRTAYSLASWAALPQDDLGVFLRLQAPAAVPLYKRMEPAHTLQQVASARFKLRDPHDFEQALHGCTLVEQPELVVVQRSAWSSMNTSAAAAAAAVSAAAAAVKRVVKRRKTRDAGDEYACERLLMGDGEVAEALRVYSPSDGEDTQTSDSCGSDDDDDDDEHEDDDEDEDGGNDDKNDDDGDGCGGVGETEMP